MIAWIIRWTDERLGSSPLIRKALRYVFPDHWSFLLGEIALYSFIVLVATGTYLALFFSPSSAESVYRGPYLALQGVHVSAAFQSTMDLSFQVPAGLLIRQTHHWAALLFVAAILGHLLRIFFTGAFRKPRDFNYYIGLTLLTLAILEGFMGYSLPGDLLSGMGLAIAYGVTLSIPIVGANLAFLLWGGEFPGSASFEPRLFFLHVFVLPAVIATLIGAHLVIIMRQKHSQFRGPGRRETNVIGTPLWPAYALRALGLMVAVAAVLVLLGGLIQINPIWQWGPYEPWLGTNGAQPDWYLGWLIGALRLMPPLEIHLLNHTWIPNPFFGGVLFPGIVFTTLYAWPFFERRIVGERGRHDLLDRPRDKPWRTALGAAFFSWVAIIFIAGAADRILVSVGFGYEGQVWFFRVAAFVVPFIVFLLTKRVCEELRATETHPLRSFPGGAVRRIGTGGFEEINPAEFADEPEPSPTRAADGL
jgi:ubiquinol-cytochrome c reductase cytochrome b subunit